jgi:predicted TIM-barrel fold metal-dependent hydrolase
MRKRIFLSGAGMHRRTLLKGLAAVTVAQLLPATRTTAAQPHDVIDVHAHYQPPAFRAMGMPGPMNAWNLQRHIDEMGAAGVARSLLSITTPGVPATGEKARGLAREANEYAAKLAHDDPARFASFLCLPMDDIDSALKELTYGFDVLKARGVGLFTSYGPRWLGETWFDPLFAELDRRNAIAYIHPTSAACCTRLIQEVPDTLIEYGTDTTRAIASYVYRGAARRFPRVRMIWSHAGGTMPFLIERFDGADRGEAAKAQAPAGFRASVANFFFDVAQASNVVAMRALRGVVPVDRIVFGTDFPFRTPLEHVNALEAGQVFSSRELRGVYRDHVARGLPELLG